MKCSLKDALKFSTRTFWQKKQWKTALWGGSHMLIVPLHATPTEPAKGMCELDTIVTNQSVL